MLDDEKRHLIRDKLLRGVLPLTPPHKVYGGKCSRHHPCDGCNEPIGVGEYELETVTAEKVSSFYHLACGHYAAETRGRLLAQHLHTVEQGGFSEQSFS